MLEANKASVRRHLEEVFNRRNWPSVTKSWRKTSSRMPPHRSRTLPRASRRTSRNAADHRMAARPAPDLHMKIEAIVAEGNLVAVRVLSEEFAFWIGFALPLGPVFGVVRTGLVPWLGLSFVPLMPAAALKPVREETRGSQVLT
jgi:hypothetical protein